MTTGRTITLALIIVGLINLYPVVGVLSAEQLGNLYGISLVDVDMIILMRHRAVLFGLLGGFILLAAFRPALQPLACGAGLVSMLAFVVIALSTGGFSHELQRVVSADIMASIGLVAVYLMRRWPA